MRYRARKPMAGACAVLLITLAAAAQGLEWRSTTIDVVAGSADTSVAIPFIFANEGKRPVKIRKIEPACGCTAAELKKRIYAPGESGVITAIFEIGSRTGLQTKTLTVATDEPEGANSYLLTFNVSISEPVRISPLFVNWEKGSRPLSRIIRVTAATDSAIEIRAVQAPPGFKATKTEIVPGREYHVTITPGVTESDAKGTLYINAGLAGGSASPRRVFLSIN